MIRPVSSLANRNMLRQFRGRTTVTGYSSRFLSTISATMVLTTKPRYLVGASQMLSDRSAHTDTQNIAVARRLLRAGSSQRYVA